MCRLLLCILGVFFFLGGVAVFMCVWQSAGVITQCQSLSEGTDAKMREADYKQYISICSIEKVDTPLFECQVSYDR